MATTTDGIAVGSDQLATSAASNNRTVLYSKSGATGYGVFYDNNLAVSSALPKYCYKSPIISGTYTNMQSVKYSDLQHYAYVEDIEPIVMFVDDFLWDDLDEQARNWDYQDFDEAREAYISDPHNMGCNPYVFDPIRYPNDSIFEWNGNRYYLWHYIGYEDGAPETLLTTVCDYDTLYSKSMEYITDVTTLKNTWPYIIKFLDDEPTYGPTDAQHDCIIKVYKPYDYLNFYRIDSSSASVQLSKTGSPTFTLETSTDYGLSWQNWTGTSITLPTASNPRLMIRGENSTFSTGTGTYGRFVVSGNVYAAGNTMSLLKKDYKEMMSRVALPSTYCFYRLFYNNSTLMSAPRFPATTLTQYCYGYMFYGCSSLTKSPILPAATLVRYCYRYLFQNCSNLIEITCLATSGINQNSSTQNWVSGVTKTGTFYRNSSYNWATGNSSRPSNFTQVNYSATIST